MLQKAYLLYVLDAVLLQKVYQLYVQDAVLMLKVYQLYVQDAVLMLKVYQLYVLNAVLLQKMYQLYVLDGVLMLKVYQLYVQDAVLMLKVYQLYVLNAVLLQKVSLLYVLFTTVNLASSRTRHSTPTMGADPLRLDNRLQPITHQNSDISATRYLIFNSNASIKSLDFYPSPHVYHVKIMFVLLISEFENQFIHFYFFNMDISFNIRDTNLKF